MNHKRLKARELAESDKLKAPDSAAVPTLDYPVFCFKHLQSGHNVGDCSQQDKIDLIERLSKLSTLTWDQIRLAPRHGFGTEKIALNSIHPTVPTFISEDVDHLLALRFSGLKPFLGLRRGPVFHIIFIDHGFDVYNHGG